MAIRAVGLSKSYRIAHRAAPVTRVTEAVAQRLRHPFRRKDYEDFTALSDVSFEIPWGEAVGIVGRNGAGKSTLLKLLTRITAPTAGRIELSGRMGSLLEVGTGFHPELTGRENIFLNGALLGMRRNEIRRRFDEIVDFSGVERFLDTPVKRYSSGMYVRLAFSVAAHLDTELLAIDEVLAVGDAEFQRKSLAKMRDVANDGRTVLYVSHQMQTVESLCTSAIFLQHGTLQLQGGVADVIKRYRGSFEEYAARETQARKGLSDDVPRILEVVPTSQSFSVDDDKSVDIRIGPTDDFIGTYFVSAHLTDANGNVVGQCDSRLVGRYLDADREQRLRLSIRHLWMKPGRYSIDVFVCASGILDSWEGSATFDILPSLPYPELTSPEATGHGAVLLDFDYEVHA
ncbi:ABC transporter ATP-binding protein [Terrabacter sp. RAF57]|uniref:ABC transporter ATP-binding protein n=1 Tax=Terrabacter sp. RAF57 TaxID=3233063 RepID=UPI003F9829A8